MGVWHRFGVGGPLDYWNGSLDYWNGLLEHWNGLLEHACHKFEVSMTIVHMHALLKRKGYFQQWISCWSCIIIILCYTVFVRGQYCDTLHSYHSMDIAHDHMPKHYDDNLLISYNHDSLLH